MESPVTLTPLDEKATTLGVVSDTRCGSLGVEVARGATQAVGDIRWPS